MKLGIRRLLRSARAAARTGLVVATRGDPTADGPYKVFVVGSGRSGTHWLGYVLDAFPATHVTVEKEPIFPLVVEIAQRPELEPFAFPKLARLYRAEHRAVLPKHYVDKSHPNLWLAERLNGEFPEARFVAIWRTLEGTVASMMKHDGVRHWVEVWDRTRRPNRFLGITEDLIPAYRRMSLPARCAVRVIAHAREIERLTGVLGRKLHVVRYEDLHSRPEMEVQRLAEFLGLSDPPDIPMPNTDSRHKWRNQLSDADRSDIRDVAARLGAEDLLDGRQAA